MKDKRGFGLVYVMVRPKNIPVLSCTSSRSALQIWQVSLGGNPDLYSPIGPRTGPDHPTTTAPTTMHDTIISLERAELPELHRDIRAKDSPKM